LFLGMSTSGSRSVNTPGALIVCPVAAYQDRAWSKNRVLPVALSSVSCRADADLFFRCSFRGPRGQVRRRPVGEPTRCKVQVQEVGAEVSTKKHVPVLGEVIQDLLPHPPIGFDTHERWPETIDVEARQDLRLREFHVHGQKIETRDAGVIQEIREPDCRHGDCLRLVQGVRGPGRLRRQASCLPLRRM